MKLPALTEIALLLFTAGTAWALAISGGPVAYQAAVMGWSIPALMGAFASGTGFMEFSLARHRRLGTRVDDLLPASGYLIWHASALLAFIYAGWVMPALFQLIYGAVSFWHQRYITVALGIDAHLGRSFTRGRKG